MNDPKCKRFHRICDDFSLCINVGERGYVLAEHPNERFTIFYYGLYGSGKFGRIFESDYVLIKSKELVDVRDYVHNEVIFQSLEDFYLIGFNTLDKSINWKAKLLNSSEKNIKVFKKTTLICLDGNVLIDDKKFKRYDYSVLDPETTYECNFLNPNSCAVIFWKED